MTVAGHSTNKIYRDNALKNFHAVEDVVTSLRIIKPAAWIWLVMFLCILTGFVIWCLFGRVEFNVEAEGILLPEKELKQSESLLSANMQEHQDKLAILKNLLKVKQKMLKNGYITILDYEQTKSDYETAKKEFTTISSESYLANLRPLYSSSKISKSENLTALIFINHNEGKQIAPGMDTYLLPAGLSSYEYGYIKGKVLSISEYPISKDTAFSYFGNANLVDDFFKNGAPFMAKVQLLRNPAASSGLLWTSTQGPNFNIQSGSMVSAKIIYKQCSPLKLLYQK